MLMGDGWSRAASSSRQCAAGWQHRHQALHAPDGRHRLKPPVSRRAAATTRDRVAIVLLENIAPGGPLSEPDECGRPQPGFITQLTGITNAMVAATPRRRSRATPAVGGALLVAHNGV
jgi:hypothetical protein